MQVNVIIAGVGGQGSILASRIIADAAIASGADTKVRVGETFGAAMRGGAVSSHVRIGDVTGPLVEKDRCDLIIGLEPLEALRIAVDYLRPGGTVILNTEKSVPTDVKVGNAEYPEIAEIERVIREMGGEVISLDASDLALKAGNPRCMNVVMLGAASMTGLLSVSPEDLLKAIRGRVAQKTIDVNQTAFTMGQVAGR